MGFYDELQQQRWDDHRFYHHNRINQFLHLLSASCFLSTYVLVFINPVVASLVGWIAAMGFRQVGHFFFEPKTFDQVYHVSHEYKEDVKVGYNLHRKVVLLSVWILMPVILIFSPDFFGLMESWQGAEGFISNTALLWLFLALGALVFRTVQLFFVMGVQSGFVWSAKIMTDPFHDIRIYYKSPYYIVKGEMYDNMTEWYDMTEQAEASRVPAER